MSSPRSVSPGIWGWIAFCTEKNSRARDLALGAIVLRVLKPNSKLAASRGLSPESASTSLGAVMGLGSVTGNEMLSMLDWLLERQGWI